MSAFTVYDEATGEILWTGNGPAALVGRQSPGKGRAVLAGDGDERSQYVDLSQDVPEVVDRMTMTPSVSTSPGQAEIANLPDPCEIRWGDQVAVATGGSATIQFDEPGTHTLTLRSEPQYLEHALEVGIP